MGGNPTKQLKQLHGEIQQQTSPIRDFALLSYDDFLNVVKELNSLSKKLVSENDNQLVFSIKKGSDTSIFWKKTVKIACIKINKISSHIISHKLLSLIEALRIHRMLSYHLDCSKDSSESNELAPSADVTKQEHSCDVDSGATPLSMPSKQHQNISSSLILERFGKDDDSALDECCICMERKPEVILPCAHNYCLPCIEQWNFCNKTCPICRETLKNTNDSWVLSEAPDSDEMTSELRKTLLHLTD